MVCILGEFHWPLNSSTQSSAYVSYEWFHSDWKVNEATMKHWNRSVQWLRIIFKGQIFTIFTSLKFQCTSGNQMHLNNVLFIVRCRVSIQRVKSLGGRFARFCQAYDIYEVRIKKWKKSFSKRKWKYFCTFNHFYSEKSSKRTK